MPLDERAMLLADVKVRTLVCGAELAVVKVRLAGLKPQVTPAGAPAQEKVIVPL